MPKRLISLILSFCLLFTQTGLAQVLPAPNLNPVYSPALLRYLSVNQANPYNYFNFLLDAGQNPETSNQKPELNSEAKKLINYFFLGITLPSESFWVNLKPDEPDRITSGELSKTDLGRTLLEQDLQLKKDASKYLHPANPKGREFWEALYQAIGKDKAKTANITASNRVWIVPDEAVVLETEDGALVASAKLKVLLENEYLKTQMSTDEKLQMITDKSQNQDIQLLSESLMKQIILPALTKDINTSPNYAPLRQIYHSLILAEWFKRKYRPSSLIPHPSSFVSPYTQAIDKGYTKGLESSLPWEKQKLWQDYLVSYNQGEYNIKDTIFGLKRMYFSGGITFFGEGAEGVSASPLTIIKENENPEILKTITHNPNEAIVALKTPVTEGEEFNPEASTIYVGKNSGKNAESIEPDVAGQEKEGKVASSGTEIKTVPPLDLQSKDNIFYDKYFLPFLRDLVESAIDLYEEALFKLRKPESLHGIISLEESKTYEDPRFPAKDHPAITGRYAHIPLFPFTRIFHGTTHKRLKLIVFSSAGYLDPVYSIDKGAAVNCSVVRSTARDFASIAAEEDESKPIVLEFSLPELKRLGIKFRLGSGLEWGLGGLRHIISGEKIPLTALTLKSKREVANLFISQDINSSNILAKALGYSSFEELSMALAEKTENEGGRNSSVTAASPVGAETKTASSAIETNYDYPKLRAFLAKLYEKQDKSSYTYSQTKKIDKKAIEEGVKESLALLKGKVFNPQETEKAYFALVDYLNKLKMKDTPDINTIALSLLSKHSSKIQEVSLSILRFAVELKRLKFSNSDIYLMSYKICTNLETSSFEEAVSNYLGIARQLSKKGISSYRIISYLIQLQADKFKAIDTVFLGLVNELEVSGLSDIYIEAILSSARRAEELIPVIENLRKENNISLLFALSAKLEREDLKKDYIAEIISSLSHEPELISKARQLLEARNISDLAGITNSFEEAWFKRNYTERIRSIYFNILGKFGRQEELSIEAYIRGILSSFVKTSNLNMALNGLKQDDVIESVMNVVSSLEKRLGKYTVAAILNSLVQAQSANLKQAAIAILEIANALKEAKLKDTSLIKVILIAFLQAPDLVGTARKFIDEGHIQYLADFVKELNRERSIIPLEEILPPLFNDQNIRETIPALISLYREFENKSYGYSVSREIISAILQTKSEHKKEFIETAISLINKEGFKGYESSSQKSLMIPIRSILNTQDPEAVAVRLLNNSNEFASLLNLWLPGHINIYDEKILASILQAGNTVEVAELIVDLDNKLKDHDYFYTATLKSISKEINHTEPALIKETILDIISFIDSYGNEIGGGYENKDDLSLVLEDPDFGNISKVTPRLIKSLKEIELSRDRYEAIDKIKKILSLILAAPNSAKLALNLMNLVDGLKDRNAKSSAYDISEFILAIDLKTNADYLSGDAVVDDLFELADFLEPKMLYSSNKAIIKIISSIMRKEVNFKEAKRTFEQIKLKLEEAQIDGENISAALQHISDTDEPILTAKNLIDNNDIQSLAEIVKMLKNRAGLAPAEIKNCLYSLTSHSKTTDFTAETTTLETLITNIEGKVEQQYMRRIILSFAQNPSYKTRVEHIIKTNLIEPMASIIKALDYDNNNGKLLPYFTGNDFLDEAIKDSNGDIDRFMENVLKSNITAEENLKKEFLIIYLSRYQIRSKNTLELVAANNELKEIFINRLINKPAVFAGNLRLLLDVFNPELLPYAEEIKVKLGELSNPDFLIAPLLGGPLNDSLIKTKGNLLEWIKSQPGLTVNFFNYLKKNPRLFYDKLEQFLEAFNPQALAYSGKIKVISSELKDPVFLIKALLNSGFCEEIFKSDEITNTFEFLMAALPLIINKKFDFDFLTIRASLNGIKQELEAIAQNNPSRLIAVLTDKGLADIVYLYCYRALMPRALTDKERAKYTSLLAENHSQLKEFSILNSQRNKLIRSDIEFVSLTQTLLQAFPEYESSSPLIMLDAETIHLLDQLLIARYQIWEKGGSSYCESILSILKENESFLKTYFKKLLNYNIYYSHFSNVIFDKFKGISEENELTFIKSIAESTKGILENRSFQAVKETLEKASNEDERSILNLIFDLLMMVSPKFRAGISDDELKKNLEYGIRREGDWKKHVEKFIESIDRGKAAAIPNLILADASIKIIENLIIVEKGIKSGEAINKSKTIDLLQILKEEQAPKDLAEILKPQKNEQKESYVERIKSDYLAWLASREYVKERIKQIHESFSRGEDLSGMSLFLTLIEDGFKDVLRDGLKDILKKKGAKEFNKLLDTLAAIFEVPEDKTTHKDEAIASEFTGAKGRIIGRFSKGRTKIIQELGEADRPKAEAELLKECYSKIRKFSIAQTKQETQARWLRIANLINQKDSELGKILQEVVNSTEEYPLSEGISDLSSASNEQISSEIQNLDEVVLESYMKTHALADNMDAANGRWQNIIAQLREINPAVAEQVNRTFIRITVPIIKDMRDTIFMKLAKSLFAEAVSEIKENQEKFADRAKGIETLELEVAKSVWQSVYGATADICIWNDLDLLDKESFLPIAMKSEGQFMGYINMHIVTKKNGEKVVLLAGINPTDKYLTTHNVKEIYDTVIKTAQTLAYISGADTLGISMQDGTVSNRGQIRDLILSQDYTQDKLEFGHPVGKYGSTDYGSNQYYVVWQRIAKPIAEQEIDKVKQELPEGLKDIIDAEKLLRLDRSAPKDIQQYLKDKPTNIAYLQKVYTEVAQRINSDRPKDIATYMALLLFRYGMPLSVVNIDLRDDDPEFFCQIDLKRAA